MPCYDGREPSNPVLERHNSELASMLCEAMRVIESFKLESQVTPRVNNWWQQHKERDSTLSNEERLARINTLLKRG